MTQTDEAYVPFARFTEWGGQFDRTSADLYAARLADRRGRSTEEERARAVTVATRYAAVDTGAIEGLYTTNRGFTRTIATQSAAWQAALAQQDDQVARSIQDALNGYEMVLDATTEQIPITEAWIRQLHELLCASQETYRVYTAVGPREQSLPKGSYKTMPNSPTNADTGRVHHYAGVEDTSAEMHRFVEELETPEFASAHPVVQASYAHYAFVCVHPFADGNGRVSRALASAFLYRSPGVPLVIFADQKDQYIDALEAADEGRHDVFTSFIEQRVLDAVDLVITSMDSSQNDHARDVAARIRSDSSGPSGLPHSEMDSINYRLAGLAASGLVDSYGELELGPGITFNHYALSQAGATAPEPPEGFRRVGATILGWLLQGPGPAEVSLSGQVVVWTRMSGTLGAEFRVADLGGGAIADVSLRDVYPAETELLRIKLLAFAEAFFNAYVGQIGVRTREWLVQQGYLPPDG